MSTVDNLGRLIAAAEDLTDEGMVNLQKLLEALVYAVVRVEARPHRREGNPAERIEEIGKLINELPDKTIPSAFREVLENAIKHYRANPSGDLTYEQAPDIFVCRGCGNVAVAEAPDFCPVCGVAAGVYRHFTGIFNGDNTEPDDPADLIELLEENARQLESIVSNLDETECTRRPFAGRWSIREHVTHFLDAQAVLIGRISLILTEDTPLLKTAVPYVTATDAKGRPTETQDILEAFIDDRNDLTARLRALSVAELWKRGRHQDFGLVSIIHQVKYFANHEQAHMGEIAALRETLVG